MRRRRAPEIIAGRVNADGTIATGDGFTSVKSSTGIYVVTLQSGFRLLSVVSWSLGATTVTSGGNTIPGERSFTVSSFVVNTVVNADAGFCFIAAGVQQ